MVAYGVGSMRLYGHMIRTKITFSSYCFNRRVIDRAQVAVIFTERFLLDDNQEC